MFLDFIIWRLLATLLIRSGTEKVWIIMKWPLSVHPQSLNIRYASQPLNSKFRLDLPPDLFWILHSMNICENHAISEPQFSLLKIIFRSSFREWALADCSRANLRRSDRGIFFSVVFFIFVGHFWTAVQTFHEISANGATHKWSKVSSNRLQVLRWRVVSVNI